MVRYYYHVPCAGAYPRSKINKNPANAVFSSKSKENYIEQIQRYLLFNHLYWMANGKPSGHQYWNFIDSPEIHSADEKQIAAMENAIQLLQVSQKIEKLKKRTV